MAAASTGSFGSGQQECSICNELLMTPKLLPCGHQLCRQCLVSWIVTKKEEAACPLCRHPILCAQSQQQHSGTTELGRALTIADSFPTDLFMEKMVEAERLLSQKHACQACESEAATALCLQCWDPLCPSCKAAHGKLSMSRRHTVEELASLTPQKLAGRGPTFCSAHPGEVCRLYCPTHGDPVCFLCGPTTHRACTELTELDKQDADDTRSMDDLLQQLSAGEMEIEHALKLLDRHWEKTDENTRKAIASIEETGRRLAKSLQAWENNLIEQTRREHENVKVAVMEAKQQLQRRRGQLSTHKAVLSQGQQMKNRQVVHRMLTSMVDRVQQLDRTAILPYNAPSICTMELSITPQAVVHLEQAMSALGRVVVSTARNTVMVKPMTLRFHDNHGRHINLSNNQQTATKTGQHYDGGILIACEPMRPGFLYEVKIDYQQLTVTKRRLKLEFIALGAVMDAPHLIDLPDISSQLQCAFVRHKHVRMSPDSEECQVTHLHSESLKALRAGDRVGVSLGTDKRLRVYFSGQMVDSFPEEIVQPCYALFELNGRVGQVTAMPVTMLTNTV